MQQKSRILVFTTAYRPMIGGSEIALEEIISRLPNIFFDIITPRLKKEFKTLESGSNFNIHRIGSFPRISKIMFPVLGFLKAISLTRNTNYYATHAYQASYGGGAAWLFKIFHPRLPFILTMQEGKKLDSQALLLNWLRSMIIKKADVITVISNYLKEYISKTVKNKKIVLIPNGVDLDKFRITDHKLQTELKFPHGMTLPEGRNKHQQTIITVSRLVPKNGLSDLITAFHILKTRHKLQTEQCKLIIIGDGPQREELFNLAQNLGIENNIEFLGSISNEKLPEYLSLASVFVRPSLSEGLGTAFLEAMAMGLPVVATSVGGIPDFLSDGETGLFCRVGDPVDIAEKIKIILSDENFRNKLISNGRKLIEEKYDWDKIASNFNDLYASI